MKKQQKKNMRAHYNIFEVDKNFLDEFPRIIGNSCFLVLELAVLQSPAALHAISSTVAWVSFFILLIVIRYINKWVNDKLAMKSSFRKLFFVLLFILIALIIITSLFNTIYILTLFGLLIVFHVVFILYINLRRVRMEKKAETDNACSKTNAERTKHARKADGLFLYSAERNRIFQVVFVYRNIAVSSYTSLQ